MPMQRSDFARLAVLVADPSQHMVTLVASMLRTLGVKNITEVNDSHAAQFALTRQTYDVLLVDEALAPLDGVKLTRKLRQDAEAANRQTVVVMTFAIAELRRITEARDAGVTEFIRKPLSAAILAARIETALANPREFVAAEDYVGPDRRRKRAAISGEDRRRNGE